MKEEGRSGESGARVSHLVGDCREVLRGLPAGSVHCVVTSPPYWGLRDYGIEPSVWGGSGGGSGGGSEGDGCAHEWGVDEVRSKKDEVKMGEAGAEGTSSFCLPPSDFCSRCGAWRGCLGLEPTFELFIAHMVEVFAEVWRVLRDDGTVWLNLGDCYATGAGAVGSCPGGGEQGSRWAGYKGARGGHEGKNGYLDGANGIGPMTQPNRMPQPGLKPKDLVGIPWRVALALQAAGWWLRSDIVWAKPNPMPESVTDRPVKAHEYVFLLSKRERYFYDAVAVMEPAEWGDRGSRFTTGKTALNGNRKGVGQGSRTDDGQRNKRSVWTIPTQAFPEAHFATFPEELVRPCILAGSSAKGCCPRCGAPWVRLTERRTSFASGSGKAGNVPKGKHEGKEQALSGDYDIRMGPVTEVVTVGWRVGCKCVESAPSADGAFRPYPPESCVVLDPFGGSGTVGKVALEEGRSAVLIDRNPGYVEMQRRRCGVTPALPGILA